MAGRGRKPTGAQQEADDGDEVGALVAFESDPRNRIAVPRRLRNPHPVVVRVRDTLSARGCDHFGLLRTGAKDTGCADVAVSAKALPRALLLLNTLIRAVESRGWSVVSTPADRQPRLLILGQDLGLTLREKIRVSPAPESELEMFGAKVVYAPRGALELGASFAKTMCDDAGRLEDRLNEFLVGLVRAAVHARKERELWRRSVEDRAASEAMRKEEEALRMAERARVERLETHADRYERAGRLRAYVAAVRAEALRRHGAIDPDGGLARWLGWAEEHVRKIDPLSPASPLPSLDPKPD